MTSYAIYSGSFASYYGLDRMIIIDGSKSDVGKYIKTNVSELFECFVMIGSCTYYTNDSLTELQLIIKDIFNIHPQETPIVSYFLSRLKYDNKEEIIINLQNRIFGMNNEDLVDQFHMSYMGPRHSECFFLHIREVQKTSIANVTILDHVKNISNKIHASILGNQLTRLNFIELARRNFWRNGKSYLD